jgi:hypothetical protein
MIEQPELDLPPPAPRPPERRRREVFAGWSRGQLIAGALILVLLLWSMWVTKQLLTPKEDRIVSARLSSIVGEYVQAQAHSASPPAQVEAEMKAFMASLDKEIQSRSAGGQVVLVGEAVLTRNVPDITESLKKAVYASGIRMPHQASAQDFQRLQQQINGPAESASIPFPTPTVPNSEQPGSLDPSASVFGATSPGGSAGPPPVAPRQPTVSSFGGTNGLGGE